MAMAAPAADPPVTICGLWEDFPQAVCFQSFTRPKARLSPGRMALFRRCSASFFDAFSNSMFFCRAACIWVINLRASA